MTRASTWLLALVPTFVWACGSSTPVPQSKVASAENAISYARQDGAAEDSQASTHLRFAEEQVRSAKALIRDGDNDRASVVLTRAQADAEAADALAQQSRAKTSLDRTREEARTLNRP